MSVDNNNMSEITTPQSQENLAAMLKNKRICRFCMTQKEPLTNIYSKENRVNSSAPLPLQIMACVSIEVFTNDGMPNTICERCRLVMEHCYRFKQMCKKSDTTLRQFPLTGIWPGPLEVPKLPMGLIRMQNDAKKPTILNAQTQMVKIERSDESSGGSIFKTERFVPPPSTRNNPKILNKSSMKILNKAANILEEPILSKPIITKNEYGQVEIVTEIIDNNGARIEEPDPILTAEPVETNVFPCPHCERSFPLRQLLDIHMVNHNRERSFACEVCDKRFFSKYDLGKHMLIHTGEKPYQCVVCQKSFTRSTLLHRHEKIHTDQPKFLCVYCEKPFLSKEELEKHTDRHKKNRPFQCKICGKSFAFKQGLERHETVHAKVQPFPCQYCEQSFSTPSKLSRHLTAHAGERPFPCKLCPKSYLLSHHLTRHLRSHTQGSGSYKCYDCERTFTTRDDLIYHSAVHATQNLMCPLCKEQFDNLDQVTEHIKQHAEGEQYACEFCDLIFLTADRLQQHSDIEHADDMAAYEKNNYANSSADDTEQGDEVIQEFIIEEYHAEEEGAIANQATLIKEEKDKDDSMPKSSPILRVEPEQQKMLNKQQPSVALRQSKGNAQKPSVNHIEEADEEMEVEELYQKDADDELYNPEQDDDEEEDEHYEPPKKSAKIVQKVTAQGKQPIQKRVYPRRSIHDPAKMVKALSPPPSQMTQIKTETGAVQQSVASVLRQLPKSVTVVKKDKPTSAPTVRIPISMISPSATSSASTPPTSTQSASTAPTPSPPTLTQSTPISPTSATPGVNKGIRILNEKIIQKADPIKKPIDPLRLLDHKTPVKVIESKAVKDSGKAVKDSGVGNISSVGGGYATRKKQSPQPGPSRAATASAPAKPIEAKTIPKQSPTTSSQQNKPTTTTTVQQQSKQQKPEDSNKKVVEMMIDNRKVKVQKIVMTKAEVAAMAKEGKIEMKGGTMILKQNGKSIAGKVVSKSAASK